MAGEKHKETAEAMDRTTKTNKNTNGTGYYQDKVHPKEGRQECQRPAETAKEEAKNNKKKSWKRTQKGAQRR